MMKVASRGGRKLAPSVSVYICIHILQGWFSQRDDTIAFNKYLHTPAMVSSLILLPLFQKVREIVIYIPYVYSFTRFVPFPFLSRLLIVSFISRKRKVLQWRDIQHLVSSYEDSCRQRQVNGTAEIKVYRKRKRKWNSFTYFLLQILYIKGSGFFGESDAI